MKRFLSIVALMLFCGSTQQSLAQLPPPINLPFDAIYMVSEPGRTDPIASFDLGGQPPALLIDMPSGTYYDFFSYVEAKWKSPDGSNAFLFTYPTQAENDKLWFQPEASSWDTLKSPGAWRIEAKHSQVELIMIYGVGVGHEWARGNGAATFTMWQAMPGDFDFDGDIDGRDFLEGQRGESTNPFSAGDLEDWQANYGAGALVAESFAVPEPGSLILVGALLAVIPVGLRGPRP